MNWPVLVQRGVGVCLWVVVLCVLAAGEAFGATEEVIETTEQVSAAGTTDETAPGVEAAQEQAEAPGSEQTLAVIRLTGRIGEGPEPSLFTLAGDLERTYLAELTDRLGQASEDESIDAVLLTIEQPEMTWAQVDELRQALGRLRQAGKKTYAYVETASTLSYLAACGCDEIVMGPEPAGTLLLAGLNGTTLYYGELLAKLGLEADIVHAGAYKSAGEPLTRTGPSEAAEEQMNRLFDSLYGHLLESIATSRGLSRKQVRRLIDRQPIWGARAAQEAHLVDRVMTRREFLASLREETGGAVRLRLDYGLAKGVSLEAASPFEALGLLQQMLAPPKPAAGPAVAVVYVDGMIMPGQSGEGLGGKVTGDRTLRMALDEAAKDEDIKAVVLRIDSPGGSGAASEVIYQAVGVCAARKPVVVSMGHVRGPDPAGRAEHDHGVDRGGRRYGGVGGALGEGGDCGAQLPTWAVRRDVQRGGWVHAPAAAGTVALSGDRVRGVQVAGGCVARVEVVRADRRVGAGEGVYGPGGVGVGSGGQAGGAG